VKSEGGSRNSERKEDEKMGRWDRSRTRRRPIGQDDAAAKDAEFGKKEDGTLGSGEGGRKQGGKQNLSAIFATPG